MNYSERFDVLKLKFDPAVSVCYSNVLVRFARKGFENAFTSIRLFCFLSERGEAELLRYMCPSTQVRDVISLINFLNRCQTTLLMNTLILRTHCLLFVYVVLEPLPT